MIITKETKERFVELLKSHEIIVVWRWTTQKYNNKDFKVIGAHNGLYWDFTPCIIDATGCKTNLSSKDIALQSVARSTSPHNTIKIALKNYRSYGIDAPEELVEQITWFKL